MGIIAGGGGRGDADGNSTGIIRVNGNRSSGGHARIPGGAEGSLSAAKNQRVVFGNSTTAARAIIPVSANTHDSAGRSGPGAGFGLDWSYISK